MKVEVTYTVPVTSEEIDLADYGYNEYVKWEDLTEDQQTEITDQLRESYIINASFRDIEP